MVGFYILISRRVLSGTHQGTKDPDAYFQGQVQSIQASIDEFKKVPHLGMFLMFDDVCVMSPMPMCWGVLTCFFSKA